MYRVQHNDPTLKNIQPRRDYFSSFAVDAAISPRDPARMDSNQKTPEILLCGLPPLLRRVEARIDSIYVRGDGSGYEIALRPPPGDESTDEAQPSTAPLTSVNLRTFAQLAAMCGRGANAESMGHRAAEELLHTLPSLSVFERRTIADVLRALATSVEPRRQTAS